MIAEARQMCRADWGPYPELAEICREGGTWVFRFRNHEHDAKPSTYVRGGYHEGQVEGGGHSLAGRRFFLPEGLTAHRFGDYLAIRFGMMPPRETGASDPPPETKPPRGGRTGPMTFEDLKNLKPYWVRKVRSIEASFPEPISYPPPLDLRDRYRPKILSAVSNIEILGGGALIVQSAEGIGKSTALSAHLLRKQFEDWTRDLERFACMAFRSKDQAEEKVREFQAQDLPAVMIRTFRDHYERACKKHGDEPIHREDFGKLGGGRDLVPDQA